MEEKVLVKIEWRGAHGDANCVQVMDDKFIVHEHLDQREWPCSRAEYRYEDLKDVRRDGIWIFIHGDEGKAASLLLNKARMAQHVAGILLAGVRGEPKNFQSRVERARQTYGTDTEVLIKEKPRPEYRPEGLVEKCLVRSEADARTLWERLQAHPSLPSEEVSDVSRELPLMLEANYPLEGGGYVSLGAGVNGWHYCPHDGFHTGKYASSEDHALDLLRDAIGATIYLEDRREHSNIQYLRRSVIR